MCNFLLDKKIFTVLHYFQTNGHYAVVSNSKFAVSRTACKDGTSYYKIDNKKVTFKEVINHLRKYGIDRSALYRPLRLEIRAIFIRYRSLDHRNMYRLRTRSTIFSLASSIIRTDLIIMLTFEILIISCSHQRRHR